MKVTRLVVSGPSTDEVRSIFNAAKPQLARCWQEASPPPAALSVEVIANGLGKASSVQTSSACVTRVLEGLRYPPDEPGVIRIPSHTMITATVGWRPDP